MWHVTVDDVRMEDGDESEVAPLRTKIEQNDR